MATKANPTFDPKAFLATVQEGRTVSDYRPEDVVFLQGSPADGVFYIQKGKIKIVVTSKQGQEAVVAMLGPGEFFGEGCPDRPAAAAGDGQGHDRERSHAGEQK
jgi:CRP/FNR family transcriptional regulator, cyclic AMP receptor protein